MAGTRTDENRASVPPRAVGRYRVVAELARGSTSIVYLAMVRGPEGFHKLFALKQLRAALAVDPAHVSGFVAEARLGARLGHPNVVPTFEIECDVPQPCIVMEYLDGQTLARVVSDARVAFAPLPLHMHLSAIGAALEGLAYAHTALGPDGEPLRVVHRDVGPHNVFVTVTGEVKLLDFGTAQTIDAPGQQTTSAARPAYMSPEQAAGDDVDARSDLFSIGVMLWEAVTRKRFWGDTMSRAEIVEALAARRLPDTRLDGLASASQDLRSLVAKATSPEPADRYESAAALQGALLPAIRSVTPPAFGMRDLGKRVTTLYANDRARLRAAIDAELAAPPPAMTPSAPPPAVAPISAPPPAVAPAAAAAAVASTPTSDRPPPASTPVPTSRPVSSAVPLPRFPDPPTGWTDRWTAHRREIAAAVLVVAVLGGVGLASFSGRRDVRGAAATVAPPPPGTAASEPAGVAEAKRTEAPVLETKPIEAPVVETNPAEAPVVETKPAEAPVVETKPAEAPAPLPLRRPAESAPAFARPAPAAPPISLAASPKRHAPAPDEGGPAFVPTAPAAPSSSSARPSRPIDAINPYAP
jgi:eukaryotic-like serine/threonine-protein kinase